jgi:ribosomal protein S27E
MVARGYALTACGLTSVVPGHLTTVLARMTCDGCRSAMIARGECPECGARALAWGFTSPHFWLGCGSCSETLLNHVSPVLVAEELTSSGWRP